MSELRLCPRLARLGSTGGDRPNGLSVRPFLPWNVGLSVSPFWALDRARYNAILNYARLPSVRRLRERQDPRKIRRAVSTCTSIELASLLSSDRISLLCLCDIGLIGACTVHFLLGWITTSGMAGWSRLI